MANNKHKQVTNSKICSWRYRFVLITTTEVSLHSRIYASQPRKQVCFIVHKQCTYVIGMTVLSQVVFLHSQSALSTSTNSASINSPIHSNWEITDNRHSSGHWDMCGLYSHEGKREDGLIKPVRSRKQAKIIVKTTTTQKHQWDSSASYRQG